MPQHGDYPTYPLLAVDRSSAISLSIPQGKAIAMPSIRITADEEKLIQRSFYGGKGDKPHLGGFTDFDCMGISPSLWKYMVTQYGIKSILDVGCGRGVSTSWFITHGLEYVQCVEGSHDAILQSNIPQMDQHVVEHDFSRGPWWPDRTVDAVWAVEFTEHVGRNYQPNYITAFHKAALIFVTHSNWGGWHHVEVHNDDWWRVRWEAAGLVYSEILTMEARKVALNDQGLKKLTLDMKEDYLYYVGQHVYLNMQVFINPMVNIFKCFSSALNTQNLHPSRLVYLCFVTNSPGGIFTRACTLIFRSEYYFFVCHTFVSLFFIFFRICT
jgi:hypothetical protein